MTKVARCDHMASPARETTVTSKTQHVIDDITRQIRSGALSPGQRLPSAREMREHYDVSQMTIRTAIERLRGAGWVTTVPGAGAYVSQQPPIA